VGGVGGRLGIRDVKSRKGAPFERVRECQFLRLTEPGRLRLLQDFGDGTEMDACVDGDDRAPPPPRCEGANQQGCDV